MALQAYIDICSVKLVHDEPHAVAYITAIVQPLDIRLQQWRIVLGSGGRLCLESPFRRLRSGKSLATCKLPEALAAEMKTKAFAAYFAAGGAPGAIAHDAPNSAARRRQRKAAAIMLSQPALPSPA